MAFQYPGESHGHFEDTEPCHVRPAQDPYRRQAIRRAREASAPYSRVLTQFEVEEKHLDQSYTWQTDGRGHIVVGEPRLT